MRFMFEGVGYDIIFYLNLICFFLIKIKLFDYLCWKLRVSCKIWKVINLLNYFFKGNWKIKWKIVLWEGIFLSNYLWLIDIFL